MVTSCPPRALVRPNIVLIGLLLALLSLAIGLANSEVVAQIEPGRVAEVGLWLAALSLLSLMAAWVSGQAARVTLLWLLGLLVIVLHGLGAVAVLMLIGLAAGSLGDRLGVDARRQPALACVVGLALLLGLAGWTQGLAIHRQWVLACALIGLLWVLRRNLRALVAGCRLAAVELSQGDWRGFGPLLVLAVALLASAHTTLQFDDLAYHAALPAQLLASGVNSLDAHSQVWALAPWASDLLQGWAGVVAGSSIRGAVNTFWWLLLWLGTVELVRASGACAVTSRWAIALGASLPLSWSLLAGMQTELAGAVVVVALLTWLIQIEPIASGARARVLGLLLGLLLGLKVSNLAYVGLLAAAALLWAPRRSLQCLPWALPMALISGGSSYAYSAWITGNPVLPLFNGWFKSDFVAPVNLQDMRYRAGLDGSDFYAALFDSSTMSESWDGIAGFQWLLLALPLLLGLIYLFRDRAAADAIGLGDKPSARQAAAAIPSRFSAGPARELLPLAYACTAVLVAALLLFWQMQYLRYLYPAMVVAGVVIGLGVERMGLQSHRWLPARVALPAMLMLCVALNLATVGNVHWQLRMGITPRLLLGDPSLQQWRDEVAPELRLVELARTLKPEGNVLLADPGLPYFATGLGRAFSTAWYDPELSAVAARCSADATGQCWRVELQQLGFSLLISREVGRDPALAVALEDWASMVASNGSAQLYRLPPVPDSARNLYLERRR